MKLIYLPQDRLIVQDDADHPIIANLSMAITPPDIDLHRLGHLMASAPQCLKLMRQLLSGERDDWGGHYLSGPDADVVRDAIANLAFETLPIQSTSLSKA